MSLIIEEMQPSTDVSTNRSGKPGFQPGNKHGRGNPAVKYLARNRFAVLKQVKLEDLYAALAALIKRAKAGDVPAIKELFDRTTGKVQDEASKDQGSQTVQMFLVNIQQVSERQAIVDGQLIAPSSASAQLDQVQQPGAQHADGGNSAVIELDGSSAGQVQRGDSSEIVGTAELDNGSAKMDETAPAPDTKMSAQDAG